MAIARVPCAGCRGTVGVTAGGARADIHHAPCAVWEKRQTEQYVPRAMRGFTAPTTMSTTTESIYPRAVEIAVERLRSAGALPLQQGDQDRDGELGVAARLTLLWAIETDQPLPRD